MNAEKRKREFEKWFGLPIWYVAEPENSADVTSVTAFEARGSGK
jgi:hypothetical protein